MLRSRKHPLRRALPGLALSLILAACETEAPLRPSHDAAEEHVVQDPKAKDTIRIVEAPIACTLEQNIMMAYVVDGAGRPVGGAEVEVSRPDGRTKRVEQGPTTFGPGYYTVFIGGFLPLDTAGTRITARFSKDGRSHTEEYLLRDEGCHHFSVLSAPDTVRTEW
jgi:hypothetical protein